MGKFIPYGVKPSSGVAGFTLIELLVVMAMAGILAAIAAPSWAMFVNSQRLGAAQERTFQELRLGQSKARQNRRVWEVCFRDTGRVEYSVHPRQPTGPCTQTLWQPIIDGVSGSNEIAIDIANTTLANRGGVYRAQFTPQGWTNGQLGRVSFILRDRPEAGRTCVFVSTLLGALRADRDRNCER